MGPDVSVQRVSAADSCLDLVEPPVAVYVIVEGVADHVAIHVRGQIRGALGAGAAQRLVDIEPPVAIVIQVLDQRRCAGRLSDKLVRHSVAVRVPVRRRVIGEGVEEVENAVVVPVFLLRVAEAVLVRIGREALGIEGVAAAALLALVGLSVAVTVRIQVVAYAVAVRVQRPVFEMIGVCVANRLYVVLPPVEVAVALGVHDDCDEQHLGVRAGP